MTVPSGSISTTRQISSVLVVDDDPNQAYLLGAALCIIPGIKVQTATSAQQALYFFQQISFDLLLTDYRMSGMGGLDLAACVRALSPNTVIVMLTAFATSEIHAQARRVSVFRVLDKPADISEIRATVQAALDQTRNCSIQANDECPVLESVSMATWNG